MSEGAKGHKLDYLPFLNDSFPDLYPTLLRVEWDFNLNMNHPMCPTGAITLVHVEAVSQPQMAS